MMITQILMICAIVVSKSLGQGLAMFVFWAAISFYGE